MNARSLSEKEFEIIEESFVVGYSTQTKWSLLIASAFFLGELGAGLFVVSAAYNYYIGALFGFAAATIGKGITHLLYLGRPERFLRIFLKPKTSWISRGLISIAIFGVFGLIYLFPFISKQMGINLFISEGSSIWFASKIIALLASFIVITYDGFLMSKNRSIPLWNNSIIPLFALTYSILGGTTITTFFYHYKIMDITVLNIDFINKVEMFLVVLNLLMLAIFIYVNHNSTIAARKSVEFLTKGKYRNYFVGLSLTFGLVILLILLFSFHMSNGIYLLQGAVFSELVGDFTLKFVLLRSGVFYPEIY